MEINQNIISVRPANIGDCDLILYLLKELGKFELFSEKDMPVTAELIKHNIFGKKYCQALIAEIKGSPSGICTFFFSFSIVSGRPGIILEDFFILPQYRRKGVGRVLFQELAKIAMERDCYKIEWSCLSWNEGGLKFYEKLGAKQVEGKEEYCMEMDAIHSFINEEVKFNENFLKK